MLPAAGYGNMTLRSALRALAREERLNFLLTNRIPRHAATRFFGWFSRIEQPLIRDLSIAVWKTFSELELEDALEQEFASLHACFVRALKPGARPVAADPRIVASPCDAIVGACGRVADTTLIQAKGSPYTLMDLFGDAALVARYRDGTFLTLRLTAGMYHRFHAPYDARVRRITYISGDTWNVNPIALARIEKLFCKNERVVIDTVLAPGGQALALVAVAAILVAGVRLHCLPGPLNLAHRGPNVFEPDRMVSKGEELGWFEHGSTIIVFAQPGLSLAEGVREGVRIRMGQPILGLEAQGASRSSVHSPSVRRR